MHDIYELLNTKELSRQICFPKNWPIFAAHFLTEIFSLSELK